MMNSKQVIENRLHAIKNQRLNYIRDIECLKAKLDALSEVSDDLEKDLRLLEKLDQDWEKAEKSAPKAK